MNYENIHIEVSDQIGTLTISRPKAMNALNGDTLHEITRGIKELEDDNTVCAIIITGAGEKAFIAGADIAAMKEMTPSDADHFVRVGHEAMRTIEECEKPVVAMVNGYALGGGTEVMLACDFAYACETAKFGLPEVSLGIFPGFGGTQRLPRYIGEPRAKEMIFSGAVISAEQALDWGLVNKVVPCEELLDSTLELAKLLIKKGHIALSFAKKAINKGMYRRLSEGLEIEKEMFVECFASEDRKEGMAAFLEKRKPEFKGK